MEVAAGLDGGRVGSITHDDGVGVEVDGLADLVGARRQVDDTGLRSKPLGVTVTAGARADGVLNGVAVASFDGLVDGVVVVTVEIRGKTSSGAGVVHVGVPEVGGRGHTRHDGSGSD